MNTHWISGMTVLSALALGGCSGGDDVPVREASTRCDHGRMTTYQVARDLIDAAGVVADGDDRFLLFSRNILNDRVRGGVVVIDHSGKIARQYPSPSDRLPFIQDAAFGADHQAVLSGTIPDPSGNAAQAWIGKLAADFSLQWEALVGLPNSGQVVVQALPDGGAIAAGSVLQPDPGWISQPGATSPPAEASTADEGANVFLVRIGADGQVLWERDVYLNTSNTSSLRKPPASLVIGADDRLRFIVETQDGLVLISTDLDGGDQTLKVLDTRLALHLAGAAQLPDGRLALASNRGDGTGVTPSAILTLIDADGAVLWEKIYGQVGGTMVLGIAYDSALDQILLSGGTNAANWKVADGWLTGVDVNGTVTWSLERGRIDSVRYTSDFGAGSGLARVAVAPDGTALATGAVSNDLRYYLVGKQACHE